MSYRVSRARCLDAAAALNAVAPAFEHPAGNIGPSTRGVLVMVQPDRREHKRWSGARPAEPKPQMAARRAAGRP